MVVKQKRPLILSSCAAISLCLALLASWAEPLLDDYRLTVLDVGQGQCVLLQSGGRTYMVDCGGSYADDEGKLRSAWRTKAARASIADIPTIGYRLAAGVVYPY
jgi:beta-lactamase superfamily II metal-dependent hydrolase